MNKRITTLGVLLAAAITAGLSIAADSDNDDITKALQKVFPGVTPDSIKPSPMDGVSEVLIGPRLMYVSNDGKYLLQGSLIDMQTRTDISEERRNEIRLDAITDLGEDKMIVFPAEDQKHTITVFTDIDCGYCRKLHKEMDAYHKKGITVRYLMFPRNGLTSPGYTKAVTVWCSEDQQDAMTRAKNGENLAKQECENPVKEEFELGQLLGIRGTPAIITDDGTLLPGYVPAGRLAQALAAGT